MVYRTGGRYLICGISVGALIFCAAVFAQGKVDPLSVFKYQGTDREKRLLESAKKEGSVVVYTSLNLKDSVPITEAFEKKFGVKAVLWRASSEKVVQRSITETRAGRYSADVYETNGPEMEILHREKLLADSIAPGSEIFRRRASPRIDNGFPIASIFLPLPTTPIWSNPRMCQTPTRTCYIRAGQERLGWNQATQTGSAQL